MGVQPPDSAPSPSSLDTGVWVELVGEPMDLKDVADLFSQSIDVRIRGEANTYFLTESSLASLNGDMEKRNRAVEIIELVNGGARLHWPNHRALAAGSRVVTIADDGSRHESIVVEIGPAESRSRAYPPTILLGGVPVPSPLPAPPRWVEAALNDGDVAAALRILADPDVPWGRLYHVYEIVESDVGSGMDAWSSRSERERFTWTANNRPALGDDARHGHTRFQPPTNPMTLGDARKLLRQIVTGWLEARVQ